MSHRAAPLLLFLIAAIGLCATGCVKAVVRRYLSPDQARSLDLHSAYLKGHELNGGVYILSPWRVDSSGRFVSGRGQRLGVNREVTDFGPEFTVPIDSVALFETNVVRNHPAVTALAVITGVTAVVAAICASNPKACFGSCPTFYAWDGEKEALMAEGFSASVLPALEATDIDALHSARPRSREFEVCMKNEALETHVVRSVDVLVAARPEGGRVFHTVNGEFWQASTPVEPIVAMAAEGACLGALRALDGYERFSHADSIDLGRQETIDLSFPAPARGRMGFVIGARQTLLTTFLFYQELAWMGRSAGDILAALNRGDPHARTNRIGHALGGIEVMVRDPRGQFVRVGEISETGPLATDVWILPCVPPTSDTVWVQLRMTRGHWRLDYVGLAELKQRIQPQRLRPETALRDGLPDDAALAALLDPNRVLTTMRGDEYRLHYRLPQDFERDELFLEARGYYLEWMRDEWLAEEDPARAIRMLLDPARALHELAPEFAHGEAERERVFWGSRYARP